MQRPFRVHLLSPAVVVQSGRATVWRQSCALATSIVPRIGKNRSCPRAQRAPRDSRSWARKSCSGPDPEGTPAFAKPEIYEALEKRGVKYAIRIPSNDSLERDISELLTRLSCHRFRSNEVRLWLSLIAYNLGDLWRGVPSGPGVAEEDRELAADQLAAKAGENRRSFDQARAVLFAAAGREPSGRATVWEHGTADRCAEGGYRVAGGR